MTPTERIAEFCRERAHVEELLPIRHMREAGASDACIVLALPLLDHVYCHRCLNGTIPCECEYREE